MNRAPNDLPFTCSGCPECKKGGLEAPPPSPPQVSAPSPPQVSAPPSTSNCTSNDRQTRVEGVGGWGGLCTCPDGVVYQVGDLDGCKDASSRSNSLACYGGGVPGRCSNQNTTMRWRGAGVAVTCGICSPSPPPPTPPTPPTPPPSPPQLTEQAFRNTYEFFLDLYAATGQQTPFTDPVTTHLVLPGGTCAADITLDRPAKSTSAMNFPPADWQTRSDSTLSSACEAACLGVPGQSWKKMSVTEFATAQGGNMEMLSPGGALNPADPSGPKLHTKGLLYCPLLSENVFEATKYSGSVTLAVDNHDLLTCPGISFASYLKEPNCVFDTDPRENCGFRLTKIECDKATVCKWIGGDDPEWMDRTMFAPIFTNPENVASIFYPPNRGIPGLEGRTTTAPECKCVTDCPALQYSHDSTDRSSTVFGRKLTVRCGSSDMERICEPSGYSPWPTPKTRWSDEYLVVTSEGPQFGRKHPLGHHGACRVDVDGTVPRTAPFVYYVVDKQPGAAKATTNFDLAQKTCENSCNERNGCVAFDVTYYSDQSDDASPRVNGTSTVEEWQIGCRLYSTNVKSAKDAEPDTPSCMPGKKDAPSLVQPHLCFPFLDIPQTFFMNSCDADVDKDSCDGVTLQLNGRGTEDAAAVATLPETHWIAMAGDIGSAVVHDWKSAYAECFMRQTTYTASPW